MMKLTIDPEADALCLRLNDARIVDSETVGSGVVLDYVCQDVRDLDWQVPVNLELHDDTAENGATRSLANSAA